MSQSANNISSINPFEVALTQLDEVAKGNKVRRGPTSDFSQS